MTPEDIIAALSYSALYKMPGVKNITPEDIIAALSPEALQEII